MKLLNSKLGLRRGVIWGLGLVCLPSFVWAATGAGADSGSAESSVRLPKSNETLSVSDSSTVKTPISSVQPKRNGFDELSVSVGKETYVSRTATAAANSTSYTEISARVRGKTEGPVFSAAIDAGASVATDVNNYSNIEVPEAYFKLAMPFAKPPTKEEAAKAEAARLATIAEGKTVAPKADDTHYFAQVSVGRKKERWSGIDSDWSLGLVQPFNKFDALRPTEQGLVGAFAEGGVGPVSVMLYGSPFYVPEQGAPYTLSNGKFTTSSPWFTAPPDSLILQGAQRPAVYTINMPQTADVVNHTSVGARVRVADPDGEGFYIQGSLLRAPQTAVALSFTGSLALRDTTTYGDIGVFPEVVYHTVAAGDLGYASKTFAAEVSVLNERPDQPTLTPELTTSHFSPMTIVSPSIEVRTFPSRVWGPRFRVSYLDTQGGEVTAVGQYASNGNVFGPRVMFRRAVSGSIETTLHRTSKWSLDTSARWVEELSEQGSVLMTDLRLGLGDSWRISLQGDLLGSQKPTSVTETFIERYRANDRIAGRVTYLF